VVGTDLQGGSVGSLAIFIVGSSKLLNLGFGQREGWEDLGFGQKGGWRCRLEMCLYFIFNIFFVFKKFIFTVVKIIHCQPIPTFYPVVHDEIVT
jgi:hypothetical protein